MNSIILKCLQKDPAKRFQSCAELREALLTELNTIELTNCKHRQKRERPNLNAGRSPKNAIALSLLVLLTLALLFLLGDKITAVTVSAINACEADLLTDSKILFAEFLTHNHQQNKARSILQALSKKFEKQGRLIEAAKVQLFCLKLPNSCIKDRPRISELSKTLVDLLIASIEQNGPTVIIKSKGQAVSIREARANGEQSRCAVSIKMLSNAKQYWQLRRLLTAIQVQIESNDWRSFTKLFKKVMSETACEDSSCSALAKEILAEIELRETASSTKP